MKRPVEQSRLLFRNPSRSTRLRSLREKAKERAITAKGDALKARDQALMAKDEAIDGLTHAISAADTWLIKFSNDLINYPGLTHEYYILLEQAAEDYAHFAEKETNDSVLNFLHAKSAIRQGDCYKELGVKSLNDGDEGKGHTLLDNGLNCYKRALAEFKGLGGTMSAEELDIQIANCTIGIAVASSYRGNPEAKELAKRAHELTSRLIEQFPENNEVLSAHSRALQVFAYLGDNSVPQVIGFIQEAYGGFERLYKNDPSRHRNTLYGLQYGLAYKIVKNNVKDYYKHAERECQMAVELCDKWATSSPERLDFPLLSAQAAAVQGAALNKQGQFKAAAKLLKDRWVKFSQLQFQKEILKAERSLLEAWDEAAQESKESNPEMTARLHELLEQSSGTQH